MAYNAGIPLPANALTYLSFNVLGVSTESLRLMPRIMGMVTLLLLAGTAVYVWDRRAGLFALIISTTAAPLVAFSRVAMIESFCLSAQSLLILSVAAYLKGRKCGLLVGLATVLCFATKASTILFLAPAALAGIIVMIVSAKRNKGSRRLMPGFGFWTIVIGIGLGALVYWLLLIRGNGSEWWFINFEHYVGNRATRSIWTFVRKFLLIPTHTEAVLVASAPLLILSAIQALKTVSHFLSHSRDDIPSSASAKMSLFLTIMLTVSVICLATMDISGRRAVMLIGPAILLAASAFGTDALTSDVFWRLGKRSRVLSLTLVSPLIFVALRSFYALFIQSAAALGSSSPWWKPISSIGEFSVFLVFSLTLSAILIWRQQSPVESVCRRVRLRNSLLVLIIASQMVFVWLYVSERSYTVVAASKDIAKRVSPDTVVIGNGANHLCWDNRIIPLFSYPGISYANADENSLKLWNPKYAVVWSRDLYKPCQIFRWDPNPLGIAPVSEFWRSYSHVEAVYPIYDIYPWQHDPKEARGYYLLVSKSSESN